MRDRAYKIISVVLVFCMVLFSNSVLSYAGNYFMNASGSESSPEVRIGYRFAFGPEKHEEERPSIIEQLKQEETSGAGTVIAVLLLGACIVAAAIILANKADDVTDSAQDIADNATETLQDQVDEIQEEIDDLSDTISDTIDENEQEIRDELESNTMAFVF